MVDTALYRAAEYISQELIEPLRLSLIGRRLVSINPNVDAGAYNVMVTTMGELNDGMIAYSIPTGDTNRDMIRVTKANKDIPILWKDFEVPRQDIEAYDTKGIAIDTSAAQSAAYIVGKLEDEFILQGWKPDGTNYQIVGLYQGAGNDYSTSKDFGTAGNPTIAISGALALIETDNALADAYNLVLHPTQMGELRGLRNANGVREMPEIVELLNPNGGNVGRIYSSSFVTDGTGLLTPVDPARKYIELFEPQPIDTELGYDSKNPDTGPVYGRIYERCYPHIKHSEGICKLSAI